MTEKEGAAPSEGGPVKNFRPGRSDTIPEIAKSTSRQHRPHRRLSDEQLIAAIQSLRDEQQLRREDARLHQSEIDRYRTKGARYGRTFQLDVMRRKIRVWP